MNKKVALIDMDGVLYDSMPYHARAWVKMLSEIGINADYEEFFAYEGMTGYATIDLLFRKHFGHGATEDEARRLYAVKSKYFEEQGEKRVMSGAREAIEALKEKGLRRILVTGSNQRTLIDRINRDFIGGFADGDFITAADVKHGKPDPEPYLMGLKKAGATADEAIVIENAPLGIQAGKAAGIYTIAVATGPIPNEQLAAAGADLILPSMTALAEWIKND